LGRVERFNSWDGIFAPNAVLGEFVNHLVYPAEHLQVWTFTMVYGLWMTMLYAAWRLTVSPELDRVS